MSDKPQSDWNPQDDSVLHDQRGAYDEMRERCPVAHSDFLGWSLFKHEDIENVLADPETYSSASRHTAIPNGMDEPEHTPYRAVLDPYLDTEAMTTFEPRCRRIADETVRSILGRDSVDIVADFTEPFSLKSLCALLGWPLETWNQLRRWSHGNQQVAFSRDREAGKSLAAEYTGFVMKELDLRRKAGADASDDLTSSLMTAEVEGGRLSDEDIVSILRNWTAGHGTVAAGIGLVFLYLAEHEELQRQLRNDPALLPAAIDEILRVDGPLVANRRTATRDVEIGGRKIAAGDKLTLMWIAANRDPKTFDDASGVRLDRDPAENLLFGRGIHACQGIRLARLEMRVAVEELLAATNRFQLVAAESPKRDVYPSNGLGAMALRLS
ncbi:MAG: cytochrome P450 [Chloroflexia bacterium]|nr:cytochrome P450 [Chloroflexia bacterium]